jgi:hypothetical protein
MILNIFKRIQGLFHRPHKSELKNYQESIKRESEEYNKKLAKVREQADKDRAEIEKAFEEDKRQPFGLICPVNHYNIYYTINGTRTDELRIPHLYTGIYPSGTVHMILGIAKEYKYETCEDCPYWKTHCEKFQIL